MKYSAIKNNMTKSLAGLFTAAVLSFTGGCTIGLGPSVDLQAPEVSITSHKDNDSVGPVFSIKGVAYDNEGVTSLNVDFTDADIHYSIVPGVDTNWKKKKHGDVNWHSVTEDSNYYCNINGNKIEWSIGVDPENDKDPAKTDESYTLEATVQDKMGNSGRKSKAVCTVTVDVNDPYVEVYKPELFGGQYTKVVSDTSSYEIKDGNVISKLLNGDIVLSGRLSGAISFKTLRIEFDNGQLESGIAKNTSGTAVNSMEEVLSSPSSALGDSQTPALYYVKEINKPDREWTLTVKPSEWATTYKGIEYGLDTGKHIIRVVSTSLSTSNAWERKVLGYFIWYPEADKPWINATIGDDTEKDDPVDCYPGSSISGSVQDDDGIRSIVSSMWKKDGSDFVKISQTTHTLPQENAKYASWSIDVPSVSGKYKYIVTVEDLKGNKTEEIRYFETADISAPKIKINSPAENTSVILNKEGNFSFNVEASDDGVVKFFAVAWLNPALKSDYTNKIKFLTGTDAFWQDAVEKTSSRGKDNYGNIVIRLDDGTERNEYSKIKSFNLYNDMKIGEKLSGTNIPLCAQDFVFFASDGGKSTVKSITLTGDIITPEELTIDKITIGSTSKTFDDGIPIFGSTFAGKKATVSGKWKDNFTQSLSNDSKVYKPVVTWGSGDNPPEADSVTINSNGTWTAVFNSSPASGGTINATLEDFGGNKKFIQKAVSIETTASGLTRISSSTDDGSYKADTDPDKGIIYISLEFSKNTDLDTSSCPAGTGPQLKLSNGGVAEYVSGSGSTSHIFKYKIKNTDTDGKINVNEIIANGAVWKENGSNENVTVSMTDSLKSGLSQRNIYVDNTPPKVKSIKSVSSSGYFMKDSALLFMLEFTEDVSITNISGLNMQFKHGTGVTTIDSTLAGTKQVLMTYNVSEDENANPLQFDKLNATGVTVKDNAGNELTDWTPLTAPSFTGFVIDTQKPAAPSFGSWNPGDLITSDEGTSFTLTGESGASVEYSLDGGSSWIPYSGKVDIKNNGSYNVTAKQIDKAGNESENAPVKSFVINKGALFKRITAESRSGTYTNSKTATPTVITGKIEFRTEVTIEQGAKVTLNLIGGKEVDIEECKTSAGTKDVFTFKYVVADGDKITDNGKLDVTGWSFSQVKLDETNVDISFPAAGNSQRFSENRDIRILTGRPSKSGDHTFVGEGADGVLTIKFDRTIEKGLGDIVFEYDDSQAFHVPTVLTAEEYADLYDYLPNHPEHSEDEDVKVYEIGMNGATASGSTLTNDTSTKYILYYEYDDTNTAVVNAFKNAKKHIVSVPVISDAVSVSDDTLKISLGETYKLPVKGAKYTVTIPADAVYDSVQNGNQEFDVSISAPGVEDPQIRLKKTAYSITGTLGQTTTTNAKMSDAQKAFMKINCRTPGAVIKYNVNSTPSNEVRVNKSPQYYDTKTTDAEVKQPDTLYSSEVTLGGNNSVSSYNDAKGLKIAISASAAANGKIKYAYEYANRTVLKFVISGKYDVNSGGGQQQDTNITENGSKLKIKDLKVWIIGGDAPSGLNSLDPFPLSWGDSSNFKLMQESDRTTSGDNYYGKWWWVTWDVTAPTYHGFVVGDVPTDATTAGPTKWYAGECAWTAQKSNYILYPGETLTMAIEDAGTYHNNYLFRLKNEGKR